MPPITPTNIVIKKISDYGTSNFIVARTAVQSDDLLKFSKKVSSRQDREAVMLKVFDIKKRLLNCWKIYEILLDDLRKADVDFEDFQKTRRLPQISDLEVSCEKFLQNLKLVVTDISEILVLIFNFEKSGYNIDILKDESKRLLGENHKVTQVLTRDAEEGWIKFFYELRDALEHPKRDKKLEIENINLHESGKMIEPGWGITGKGKTTVLGGMHLMTFNLLTFFEDVFAMAMEETKASPIVIIHEIPEDRRDPKCPVRLKWGPSAEFPGVIVNASS